MSYGKLTKRDPDDPVPYLAIADILEQVDPATLRAITELNASRERRRIAWDAAPVIVGGVRLEPGKYYDVTFVEYRKERRALFVRFLRRAPASSGLYDGRWDFEHPYLRFQRVHAGYPGPWVVSQGKVRGIVAAQPDAGKATVFADFDRRHPEAEE